jgi:hypothetical protein
MMVVDKFPDRRSIQIEGKDYLYFGSTAYFWVSTNPEFHKILVQSINKWRSFFESANIKNKAERFFAKQIDTENTLTTTVGTLAGKLVVEYLSKFKQTFYHYPKTCNTILS